MWAPESAEPGSAAPQPDPWRRLGALSSALGGVQRLGTSVAAGAERFLTGAGFDRAPWLVVAFGCGIAAWFVLPLRGQWLALLALCLGVAGGALALLREDGRLPFVRQAIAALALMVAAGCATVWIKSVLVGTPGIARPVAASFVGVVLSRQEQPAADRTRLVVAIRDPDAAARPGVPQKIVRVRLNVPLARDDAAVREGTLVQFKARLMPPAPPMLPGSYNFARTAWFQGLAATGTVLAPITVLQAGDGDRELLAPLRRALSHHVHGQVAGSPGGIAAAFASGDRGGIAPADEDAMRDAGLTHLLSVSGLHVSAVIGGVYFLALRLLALWPWLALRVRLPLVAAGGAALAGIFYTLLTGAQVPTVRSVVGALLVLAAVALGREPLSLRLLAVAGFLVMLLWPEAVVGPSFQLSFGAVLAIIAVHGAGPVRAFAAPREEAWWARALRNAGLLLLTGVVIELALMPIVLFHFHRAGLYGAAANVIAIPMTTFVTMPLIALAMMLDLAGAGAPAWWAVGKSLELLLWLAHFVAAQPGAVTMFPAMGEAAFALFLAGGFWLGLWRGRARLWGLAPIVAGTMWLAALHPPDVLISGDGRHVGFTGLADNTLVILRDTRSSFARDNLTETAGMDGAVVPLDQWPGARCNADFCAIELQRGGREWRFLLSRGQDQVPLRDLAAACEQVDVVVSDRWLPYVCRPALLKADRATLAQTGGLALDLAAGQVATVAGSQGEHGWWRAPVQRPRGSKSKQAATARQGPVEAAPARSPSAGSSLAGTPPARTLPAPSATQ